MALRGGYEGEVSAFGVQGVADPSDVRRRPALPGGMTVPPIVVPAGNAGIQRPGGPLLAPMIRQVSSIPAHSGIGSPCNGGNGPKASRAHRLPVFSRSCGVVKRYR